MNRHQWVWPATPVNAGRGQSKSGCRIHRPMPLVVSGELREPCVSEGAPVLLVPKEDDKTAAQNPPAVRDEPRQVVPVRRGGSATLGRAQRTEVPDGTATSQPEAGPASPGRH